MQPRPIHDAASAVGHVLDDAQEVAAERLERLLEVVRPGAGSSGGGWSGGQGVYLWGPVGRGKTWLLDRFHDQAGGPRFHFHEFYRALHAEVWARTGTPDAMDRALDALLGGAPVLCFDELHLHDAGDATLLSRALRTLLARGVTLVATSNYPPQGLLPDPLFHELAEPLIALLESSLDVLRVDGPVDYRGIHGVPADGGVPSWRADGGVPVWGATGPADAAPSSVGGWRAGAILVPAAGTPDAGHDRTGPGRTDPGVTGAGAFDPAVTGADASGTGSGLGLGLGEAERLLAGAGLSRPAPDEAVDVPLSGGRSVRALRAAGGTVWFDFAGLCAAPVSALDMLSLAERFDRWVLSDVEPFADCHLNTQQRFVSLVDVLYDRDLPLVLTAPAPLDEVLSVPAVRPAPPDLARATSRLRQLGTARLATAGSSRSVRVSGGGRWRG